MILIFYKPVFLASKIKVRYIGLLFIRYNTWIPILGFYCKLHINDGEAF